MPRYSTCLEIPRPVDEVFAFFTRPASLVALAPPELQAALVDGPELLHAGGRVTWKLRRWGMSQTIVYEVTALVEGKLITLEQRQGPLARWTQQQNFDPTSTGTRLSEEIEFEPPRGMLGRLVTEATVRADLDRLFAHRAQRLADLDEPRP